MKTMSICMDILTCPRRKILLRCNVYVGFFHFISIGDRFMLPEGRESKGTSFSGSDACVEYEFSVERNGI